MTSIGASVDRLNFTAGNVGVRLDIRNVKQRRDGRTEIRFGLRTEGRPPKYGRRGHERADGSRGRIIGAVCWHGHRDFLALLFRLSPDAVVRTAFATYKGREGFEREYRSTYYREAGTGIRPAWFGQTCDCKESAPGLRTEDANRLPDTRPLQGWANR